MIRQINDAIGFILELAMLTALAFAGFRLGENLLFRWLLCIGLPLAVLLFWAKWMAPKANNRIPPPWLHGVAFLLFLSAGAALFFSGLPSWGIILAVVALLHTGLKFGFAHVKADEQDRFPEA